MLFVRSRTVFHNEILNLCYVFFNIIQDVEFFSKVRQQTLVLIFTLFLLQFKAFVGFYNINKQKNC